MRPFSILFLSLMCGVAPLCAKVVAGHYDMAAVGDASTLETKVIEDWHPWGKDTGIRQKFIEITVCEWWPGQKVRLPVTLLAPESGQVSNIVVDNAGVTTKGVAPTGAKLKLLKTGKVGVVLIAMTTIDAMEPVGKLDVGMKEHFLKSKDARFTPAWIWGMSDMRALTAALAEKDVFKLGKVIATGGSKRGVATAAAGIADDRFTGIMPIVAPVVEPPGGPYVEGMRPAEITHANEQFLRIEEEKVANAPVTAIEPLVYREKVRAAERITEQEARDAGWTPQEMKDACTLAWEVCRTTNYLQVLKKRGLEIFYNEGSNDQVSPGLLDLCKRFPSLPVFVVPGGQHGGAKETGFKKQVGSLPEVDENLYALAEHHFFNARPMVKTPQVKQHWDAAAHRLQVTATFPDKAEPQKNDLWWSVNRHPDYTFAMEYDTWQSVPMHQTGPATYSGEADLPGNPDTIDFVTVHAHEANGSTLTLSSPLVRVNTH